jgi:DNA-binding transcriptional LysR family regulator
MLIRHLVCVSGRYVASRPEFIAASALAKGTLVRVLADWSLCPFNRYLPARLRVWIDFLVPGLGQ